MRVVWGKNKLNNELFFDLDLELDWIECDVMQFYWIRRVGV